MTIDIGVRHARLAGVVSVVLALAGCHGSNGAPLEKAAPAGPPTIDVVRVVEQPINVTLSLPSEITAYETVAIYPRVTGFVQTIRVDRGSRVRAGEVIAVLEAPELVAQRSEAQSKFQSAQAQLGAVHAKADADSSTFDKLKAASATPGVVAGNELMLAQKVVEADRGQVTAAEQNVESARQALNSVTRMEDYLKVTAPFDGVVTERNIHPGALVGPNSGAGAQAPIVRIVDASRLRVVIPVPEAYTANVVSGTDVSFTVAAYPTESFSGKVARIASAVDVSTRTMAVELDVTNKGGRLAPGTFCQVHWPVHRTGPSLLVPPASVASTTGRTFVIRVRDGRTEWVDVKTGVASGALVEIVGDVHAGDVIAARGTDELRAGTEVRVKEAKPAT
ncbi:MAG TPA: efflux RND transporter periplasmic adaptor subunit [Vicinamibacterales bacterium]|nr:efflux RND transporter periplasmic adaptor subunit [Vicinamibacterales bacterium]